MVADEQKGLDGRKTVYVRPNLADVYQSVAWSHEPQDMLPSERAGDEGGELDERWKLQEEWRAVEDVGIGVIVATLPEVDWTSHHWWPGVPREGVTDLCGA